MIGATPRGFRDVLPEEAAERERIVNLMQANFASYGYLPVETPLFESHEVFRRGAHMAETPFQLFDRDGQLLVLRPDLTMSVARMVATRFSREEGPFRLRYTAPVVRDVASSGEARQFTQLGIELIGDAAATADAEVVSVLASTLDALEIQPWRIVVGDVRILQTLLDACAPDEPFKAKVRGFINDSDLVCLDEFVQEALESGQITEAGAAAIMALPRTFGSLEALDAVDDLMISVGLPCDVTAPLRTLFAAARERGFDGRLVCDFTIMAAFDYYTGLVFKAYGGDMVDSLASGGRYDSVFERMGFEPMSAAGFAFSLERLERAMSVVDFGSGVQGAAEERPLRIAVPKGSLFKDSVAALSAVGFDTSELEDPGRRLIIPSADGSVEYVIVRPTDAPAFVARGGADCGMCGRDSLIEASLDVIQLVDLRYGACRFVVAEPAEAAGKAERAHAWRGSIRVSTKYPRITQNYYEQKGQRVDIIPLHGNIELGPIVGMSDRIVDITATGTTLRENNLVIVDDVLNCTARFFASPAALRNDERVRALAARLAEYTKGQM